jgi:RNA polymerase sigma-70 factor (ECF subfamily)
MSINRLVFESPAAEADELAIAAVLQGDIDRYRELVERYQRLVYAVAWSRLGDPSLAEEVTQETFIQAFRQLRSLGDDSRFSAWISAIARHLAINLGLRHRRELARRRRWAVEADANIEAHGLAADEGAHCSPETVDELLSKLPPAHRECLVVYYLEGKSGAEAAATLGFSEGAFRVRLHRARAALRSQIEKKLEDSLRVLHPAQSRLPAIMSGIVLSAPGKFGTGGGLASGGFGILAKFGPIKFGFGAIQLLLAFGQILITFPVIFWIQKGIGSEIDNLRDPEGFRSRILRRRLHRLLQNWTLILCAAAVLLSLPGQYARFAGLLYGFCCGIPLLGELRRLRYDCSWGTWVRIASMTTWMVAFVVYGLGWGSLEIISLFCMLVASVSAIRARPLTRSRLDSNLFLRAAAGQLVNPLPPISDNSVGSDFTERDLIRFGRFLQNRGLAVSMALRAEGLVLQLPPVLALDPVRIASFRFLSRRSELVLDFDGNVSAHLPPKDEQDLREIVPECSASTVDLELEVSNCVETAWRHFVRQNPDQALRFLGEVPDDKIFLQALQRTPFFRWSRWLTLVGFVSMLPLFWQRYLAPDTMDLVGLEVVDVSPSQVQGFLDSTGLQPRLGNTDPWGDLKAAFSMNWVLPSTNLFSQQTLSRMRSELKTQSTLSQDRAWLVKGWDMGRSFELGWLTWNDLNLMPTQVSDAIRLSDPPLYSTNTWDHLLSHCSVWSADRQKRVEVPRLQEYGLLQLRLLRRLGCMDLVGVDNLISAIASAQNLARSGFDPLGTYNWSKAHGLFAVPGYPPLRDTYYALAALEILGGVDRVDREACIAGILRQHRGKGLFVSPKPGGVSQYEIDGSAHDTIAAYESLRILNALDRVPDLENWKFRLTLLDRSQPDSTGLRSIKWSEVEAWVCQQRLQAALDYHRKNPERPYPSLLENVAP